MSRTMKLVAAAFAIALTATLAGIIAYEQGRDSSREQTVRYHVSVEPQGPVVTGNVHGVLTVHAQSGRYRLNLVPNTLSVASLATTTNLEIQHVRNGCHVWSKGGLQASSLRMSLTRGARLQVLNRDVVPHQLVQVAGPNLALRGHMMIGKTQLITFKQPGVYLLKDGVVEMGPNMNVKTIGPDNMLRLTVSVS